jgi:hypothetical protein
MSRSSPEGIYGPQVACMPSSRAATSTVPVVTRLVMRSVLEDALDERSSLDDYSTRRAQRYAPRKFASRAFRYFGPSFMSTS